MAEIGIQFSCSLVDGLSNEASTLSYMLIPDTNTLAGVAAEWDNWIRMVDSLSDGIIRRGHILITPPLPVVKETFSTGQGAGCRVEECAVFNMANDTTPRKWGFSVPAFSSTFITNGKIDFTAVGGEVESQIRAFFTTVLGGGYANNTLQRLTALLDSFLAIRRKRKQLSRTSFEAR